jgi:ABC-2 type transport system ATP-binding protein
MARLTAENCWIEFPVSLPRERRGTVSRTGGAIDAERGMVTALRDISFQLRDGDRLGLMGHNGAGKTTMLRLLAGVYPPTRGRMTTIGRISTLFNTLPGLSTDGTGRENIITCALHLGMARQRIKQKMDEIIDFAELGDYIDLPVRIYSAGMLTRLGFAIATSVDPDIVLLDEGLATGDANFAHKAERRMNELLARSSILVIASHSETLLASMCNRCLLLEHGRILSDGPAQQLYSSYRASVVAAARRDDADALQRAYTLTTDMQRRGEVIPLDLEEQGLRHALRISPDDAMMMQRYIAVVAAQGRMLPAEEEASLLITLLGRDPTRADLRERLEAIMPGASPQLREADRDRAAALTAGTARPGE